MVCRTLLLGISFFSLAACSLEVEIDVAQRCGKVTFALTRSGEPVCIDRIAVYEGPEETRGPMWSVMAGLSRGKVSTVSADGPGVMGTTTFTIE